MARHSECVTVNYARHCLWGGTDCCCRMLSSRAWGTVDCIDGGWLQGAVMRNMFIFTLTMLTSAKVLPATFFPNYGNLLIERLFNYVPTHIPPVIITPPQERGPCTTVIMHGVGIASFVIACVDKLKLSLACGFDLNAVCMIAMFPRNPTCLMMLCTKKPYPRCGWHCSGFRLYSDSSRSLSDCTVTSLTASLKCWIL